MPKKKRKHTQKREKRTARKQKVLIVQPRQTPVQPTLSMSTPESVVTKGFESILRSVDREQASMQEVRSIVTEGVALLDDAQKLHDRAKAVSRSDLLKFVHDVQEKLFEIEMGIHDTLAATLTRRVQSVPLAQTRGSTLPSLPQRKGGGKSKGRGRKGDINPSVRRILGKAFGQPQILELPQALEQSFEANWKTHSSIGGRRTLEEDLAFITDESGLKRNIARAVRELRRVHDTKPKKVPPMLANLYQEALLGHTIEEIEAAVTGWGINLDASQGEQA